MENKKQTIIVPSENLRYVDVDFEVHKSGPFIKHQVIGLVGYEEKKKIYLVNQDGTAVKPISQFSGEITDKDKTEYKNFFGKDILNAKTISNLGQYYRPTEVIGYNSRPIGIVGGEVDVAKLATQTKPTSRTVFENGMAVD